MSATASYQGAHRLSRPVTWRAPYALVLFAVVAWVVADHLALPLGGEALMLVAQPLTWLLLGAIAVAVAWWHRFDLATDRRLVAVGVLAGLVQVALVWGVASLSGLGGSPYRHDALHLAEMVWIVAIPLVAREVTRWCLIRVLTPRHPTLAVVLPWLVFAVVVIPIPALAMGDGRTAVNVLGAELLPAVGASLLATQLALRGGPLPAIGYMGVLAAAEWLPPVLPASLWPGAAIVSVLFPLYVAQRLDRTGEDAVRGGVVETDAEADAAEEKAPRRRRSWAVAFILPLVTLWFVFGFAGFKPVAVDGISMQPGMHSGDLVIIRAVDPADLHVGDIVSAREGTRQVVHRIQSIDLRKGVVVLKGDNNRVPDPPVAVKAVAGRVAAHLPALGWPLLAPKLVVHWLAEL